MIENLCANQTTLLLLSSNVFVTRCGREVVALDLASDQYITITEAESAILSQVIEGWSDIIAATEPAAAYESLPARDALLSDLFNRGLITEDPYNGKPATAPIVSRVQGSLHEDALEMSRVPSAWEAFALALLSWRTRRILHNEAILGLVQHVRRVKLNSSADVALSAPDPIDVLSSYISARPFAFTSYNQCLLDSAILYQHLARRGLAAEWVFGVRTDPFSAHCWIQLQEQVLNDCAENVQTYEPIMVI